jgi:HAD superfamily phosphatase (TIGR01668 family)
VSEFRTGTFDRKRAGSFFGRFCPVRAEESLLNVDPEHLVALKKKLVLLDVDNTLVVWRSEEIPETSHDWVRRAKAAGLQLCILSNTRHPGRLDRLAKALDIPYFFGKFKPSTFMYKKALAEFNARPEEAVMIGDQIFTDVLGANRSGIEAIWVRQMAPVDFVGTKISRMGERLLRKRLYRAMAEEVDPTSSGTSSTVDEDLAVGGTAAFDLLQHPTVRQFVKFVIIGGTSTVIDIGLHLTLVFLFPWGDSTLGVTLGQWLLGQWPDLFTAIATKDGLVKPELAASPLLKVFTASLAILNSFVWNRRWTFKIKGKEHRAVQLRKFFTIALIGMALNTILTTGLGNIIAGHPRRSLAVASLVATVAVAFWNFFGQKLWTFKK